MKGKFLFGRILAFVLALAMTTSTLVSAASTTSCRCPYCSLQLEKRAGKFLYEGQTVSKNAVTKVTKITYKNKSFNGWTLKQKGNTIKYAKKGFKITIEKGTLAKKSIYLPVCRIKKIYIRQTKLTSVTAGTMFPTKKFKNKTVVIAKYADGSSKKLSNYSISTKNVSAECIVTVKFGKLKSSIAIPVISNDATSGKPTASPSASPSTTPEPEKKFYPVTINEGTIIEVKEGTIDSNGCISANALVSISPILENFSHWTNEKNEIISYDKIYIFRVKGPMTFTAIPSVAPSESGKPMASPSASPSKPIIIIVPTANPCSSGKPTASPSTTPEPEKKFYPVTINEGTIIEVKEGTIDSNGCISANALVSISPILENFSHWTNEKNEIISYDKIYIFRVKGPMTFTAIPSVTPSESGKPTTPTASPSAAPSESGKPTTPTTSPSAAPSESGKPTASPSTTPEPEKKFYPVTINEGTIIEVKEGTIDSTTGFISENALVSIGPSVENFSYWSNEKNEIISYDKLYVFRVKGPMTFTANFSNETVEKEPVVHFTGNSYQIFPEVKTVRLFMSIEVPDGYEKIEYGFLYSSENLSEDQMIVGVAKKIIDENFIGPGSADFTYDGRFNNPTVWENEEYRYFRPFGIVKDKDGNTKTIYGSIEAVQLKIPAE